MTNLIFINYLYSVCCPLNFNSHFIFSRPFIFAVTQTRRRTGSILGSPSSRSLLLSTVMKKVSEKINVYIVWQKCVPGSLHCCCSVCSSAEYMYYILRYYKLPDMGIDQRYISFSFLFVEYLEQKVDFMYLKSSWDCSHRAGRFSDQVTCGWRAG